MPTTSKQLVIGLPGAGKTTFIAALWHVLTSGEVGGALRLANLQPSREHLNDIAKLWRGCEEIPRTLVNKEKMVTLNVMLPSSELLYNVTLPDSSGEAFKRIFEKRKWLLELNNDVRAANGLLFFVHPSNIVPPQVINSDVQKMIDAIENTDEGKGGNDLEQEPLRAWSPALATPQSKIVDLLQLVRTARDNSGLKTGIVVSAWDEVRHEGMQPGEWLRQRAPLLFQYLKTNKSASPFKIFGVSAQGASLKQSDDLLHFVKASDRIEVNIDGSLSHDITAPVRWVIS
jgi:hypothetical protein